MRRRTLACALLVIAASAAAQELQLPFTGQWFVVQGGDTLNVNHHMALQAQWFGVDFAKLGGDNGRELSTPNPVLAQDFHCWGAAVLAPADARVLAVVDQLPDNALGSKDAAHPAGNHIALQVATSRFVFLAHFQRGSITVKAGDTVTRGQPLGKCGNSGNSDYPHVHLHVQDQPHLNAGTGINPVFSGMRVTLNGKTFDNVTWPLVRGLVVAPQ